MFAPPKFILILLVIFGVWYAMRWFNRAPLRAMRRRQAASPRPQAKAAAIEDLVACRVCGAYVAAGAGGCGKSGCPQPR